MQDPDKPLDDGKIRLPRVDAGMNKIAPNSLNDSADGKVRPLRPEYVQQKEDDQEILLRARKRFERCMSAEADNRRSGLDDDKFYAGDQWSSNDRNRRTDEKRPCLTFNKFPTLLKQVMNSQRENRPTIDIHPVGDKGDVNSAKIFRGLIREIERESYADKAYDTGFESAVRKGWGYWRVMPEFESPDTFDQVLRVKRILNTFSVYDDPDITEMDGKDRNFCFITEMIERGEFKDKHPNADPMNWVLGGLGDTFKNWIDQYAVRLAEYYEIINKPRELVLLNNGFEGWEDEIDRDVLSRFEVVNRRRSLVPEIWWYKITAKEILERTRWLGSWIPLVRCIGDEIVVDGKTKLSGLVRHAKDAQTSYNYFRTAEVERTALMPKAPYIVAEGQTEGYDEVWKTANTKSHPYLPYRVTEVHGHLVPPPRREPPIGVDAGDAAIAQNAQQDMLTTTGIRFDATLQERTYDESGRALRELRRSGDIGSFNYVDNLIHSKRRTGEIFVDAIPKYYTRPGRVLTMIREDDTEEQIRLNPNATQAIMDVEDPNTQKIVRAFDPTVGKYGVTVTIGPSYATQRIETSESMMDFLRAVPNAAPVIADLVVKNQDWEGAEEIAKRLASQLPPGLNQPELRDIPPQVQALLTQHQQQIAQLTQQNQMLTAQVSDRNADRQLARERINRQFEVQLLNVVQKAQAVVQKLGAEDRRTEAEGVHNLASEVLDLYKELSKAPQEGQAPNNMPASMPEGARQAPDGNFYIPDSGRPGKYLMVKHNA